MSIFAETECHFSAVSIVVYTALIHSLTCWLEARQALIYQLVLGLTGENGKYNYSRAVHLYPPFFDITCSAKNYKIAPALTITSRERKNGHLPMSVFVSCMKFWADIECKFVDWPHHNRPYLPYPWRFKSLYLPLIFPLPAPVRPLKRGGEQVKREMSYWLP